jgi:chemotaxis protein CheZ
MAMPVRQKIFRIEQMTRGGAPAKAAPQGLDHKGLDHKGLDHKSLAPRDAGPALPQHEVLAELKALRDLIEHRAPAAAPQIRSNHESESETATDQITVGDLDKLKSETDTIHRAISRTMQELASLHFGAFGDAGKGRASRELDAVVDSTERATQQILEAVEAIDEAANTLSASLRHEQEQSLASDIRDHVVRIFEACNFQDLSGQRITKVLATLTFVEDRVARMLEIWGGREALQDYAAIAIAETKSEAALASGPKLNGDSGHISQQEIDAMFA